MVAGGINYVDTEASYTTHIFDEEMYGSWEPGPWIDQAHKWSNGGYVTYTDERGLILVGGKLSFGYQPKYMLQYNETRATFNHLPRLLNHEREDPAVVLIPAGAINCDE